MFGNFKGIIKRTTAITVTTALAVSLLPCFAYAEDDNTMSTYVNSSVMSYGKIMNVGHNNSEPWVQATNGGGSEEYNLWSCFTDGTAGFSYRTDGNGKYNINTGFENGHFQSATVENEGTTLWLTVNIAENPVLKALAESGQAEMYTSGNAMGLRHENGCAEDDHDIVRSRVYIDGNEVLHVDTNRDDRNVSFHSDDWFTITPTTKIEYEVYISEWANGVSGFAGLTDMGLFVRDLTAPSFDNYTVTTTGTERTNAAGEHELLLKKQDYSTYDQYGNMISSGTDRYGKPIYGNAEYLDMTFNFSEPVMSEDSTIETYKNHPNYSKVLTKLKSHTLFQNPSSTGYIGYGEYRGLELYDVKDSNNNSLGKTSQDEMVLSTAKYWEYRYTTQYGDNYGNNPIPASGAWNLGDANGLSYNSLDGSKVTMLDTIKNGKLHDIAGNPLVEMTSNPTAVDSTWTSDDGTVYTSLLNYTAANPFDYTNGGYKILVDAYPPTYTMTGNKIFPDILTGVVLNDTKGTDAVDTTDAYDVVQYKAAFSEHVKVKDGLNVANTYLLFNNGEKAKVVLPIGYNEWYEGNASEGGNWTFELDVEDGKTPETSLLKAVALTNYDKSTGGTTGYVDSASHNGSDTNYTVFKNIDTCVLQDYVGNLLDERAVNPNDGKTSTDPAGLQVDNTDPVTVYHYATSNGSANDNMYGIAGRITIDADDPEIITPRLDPDQSKPSRPSTGIYRPQNLTGGNDENQSVGLVYYVWCNGQDELNAYRDILSANNYAQVKWYSLTASMYDNGSAKYADLVRQKLGKGSDYEIRDVKVTNNKTNLLVFPEEYRTSEYSGDWYLLSFTSDMTWDSQRQLVQYNKMRIFEDAYNVAAKQLMDAYKSGDGATAQKALAETQANAFLANGDKGGTFASAMLTNLMNYDDLALDTAVESVVEAVKTDGAEIITSYNDAYNYVKAIGKTDDEIAAAEVNDSNEVYKEVYDTVLAEKITAVQTALDEYVNKGMTNTDAAISFANMVTVPDHDSYVTYERSLLGEESYNAYTEAYNNAIGMTPEDKDEDIIQNSTDETAKTFAQAVKDAKLGDSAEQFDIALTVAQFNLKLNEGEEAETAKYTAYGDALNILSEKNVPEDETDLFVINTYLATSGPTELDLFKEYYKNEYLEENEIYSTSKSQADSTLTKAKSYAQAIIDCPAEYESAEYAELSVLGYDKAEFISKFSTARISNRTFYSAFSEVALSDASDKAKKFSDKVMGYYTGTYYPSQFATNLENAISAAEQSTLIDYKDVQNYIEETTKKYGTGTEASYDSLEYMAGEGLAISKIAEAIMGGGTVPTAYAQYYDAYKKAYDERVTIICSSAESTGILEDDARKFAYNSLAANLKTNYAGYFAYQIQTYLANNPTASYSDAVSRAEINIMTEVGNYEEWDYGLYINDDSNWMSNNARIRIDNKAPEITFNNVLNDKSANVTVGVSADDENGGFNHPTDANGNSASGTIQYQWLKSKDAVPDDMGYVTIKADGSDTGVTLTRSDDGLDDVKVEFNATTGDTIYESGTYYLYVKITDYCGNESAKVFETPVTVDLEAENNVTITPDSAEADDDYSKSVDVAVTTSMEGAAVSYAVSGSVTLPADSEYKAVEEQSGSWNFEVNGNDYSSNLVYVHVRVTEPSGKAYNYYRVYKIDGNAPAVVFSPEKNEYPLEQQSTQINVTDTMSGIKSMEYIWWNGIGDAPTEISTGWTTFNSGDSVTINNAGVLDGTTVNYSLYVKTADNAGNIKVTNSGEFAVTKISESVAEGSGSLEYISGNAADGFYGIVKMNLDIVNLEGYRYAISTDGGKTYSSWQQYTNIASVKLPVNSVGDTVDMYVKFQNQSGIAGEGVKIVDNRKSLQPVYATLSLNTDDKMKQDGVNCVYATLSVPFGITAEISDVNSADSNGNPMIEYDDVSKTYKIYGNGMYSFILKDTTDETNTETLIATVSNFDNIPPAGVITYSTIEPTRGNVLASLTTYEDVNIDSVVFTPASGGDSVKAEANNKYSFSENGSALFTISDSVGNQSIVQADVTWIDNEGPDCEIVLLNSKGETITSDSGEIASKNITAVVEKTVGGNQKDFRVPSGSFVGGGNKKSFNNKTSYSINDSGTIRFTAVDDMGNVSQLQKTLTLTADSLEPTVGYVYEDKDGNVIEPVIINGEKYTAGCIKAVISGTATAGNIVYLGKTTAGKQISDGTGAYSYERIFSGNGTTTIPISDSLGNQAAVEISVSGIDNEAPKFELNKSVAVVSQNKQDFNFEEDLGGWTVSDNVSQNSGISVTLKENPDLTKSGNQIVTYIVSDECGNTIEQEQSVYVIPGEGMIVLADGQLVSAGNNESVLLDDNVVTFAVDRYSIMNRNGQKVENKSAKYDMYYISGLYREGQMKYIAKQVTMDELLNKEYTITLPKSGWYTVIIRNAERETEFGSFFVSAIKK